MARRALEIGIRVGAQDDTGGVFRGIANNARSILGGLAAYGAGRTALNFAENITNKFKDQEYSLASLRIMEMDRLGKVNEDVYGREEQLIRGLSSTYAKSVEEYATMAVVLRQNRISSKDFLGGIGETTAHLGKVFDNMEPRVAALFFARLKNDMRVLPGEMERLANMAFKLKNIGVGGGDANMTITELTEAYSKAGLGATNLGLRGAADAEDLGVLMGTFISKGISGQTTGNNFRRIFDGLRDPERLNKVIGKGATYGVKLSFFDGNGKFKGIRNFEEQLAKIGKLDIQKRADVLKPFSGKQGLSTDFLEYLAKYADDVHEIRTQYEGITDLNSALKELLGTQRIINDQTEAAKTNMEAAFGKAISEDVKRLNRLLKGSYDGISDFVGQHPRLTGMALEFAGIATAVGSLYGGLVLVGGYIPGLSRLATGLSASFGPIMGLASSLLLLKYGYDSASSQAAQDPNSKFARNIGEFDKRIKESDEGTGLGAVWGSVWNRYRKASHGLVRRFGGAGFYESPLVSNDEAYNASPAGLKYNRTHFLGMGSMADAQGWNYAPNVTINGGMDRDSLDRVLRENKQHLIDSLQMEIQRQNNMTYGSKR